MYYVISPTDQLKQETSPTSLIGRVLSQTCLFSTEVSTNSDGGYESAAELAKIKELFIRGVLVPYLAFDDEETELISKLLVGIQTSPTIVFDKWWKLSVTTVLHDFGVALHTIRPQEFKTFLQTGNERVDIWLRMLGQGTLENQNANTEQHLGKAMTQELFYVVRSKSLHHDDLDLQVWFRQTMDNKLSVVEQIQEFKVCFLLYYYSLIGTGDSKRQSIPSPQRVFGTEDPLDVNTFDSLWLVQRVNYFDTVANLRNRVERQ